MLNEHLPFFRVKLTTKKRLSWYQITGEEQVLEQTAHKMLLKIKKKPEDAKRYFQILLEQYRTTVKQEDG